MMKRTAPRWWYENKKKKIFSNAKKEMIEQDSELAEPVKQV
jgi:hypothetical protein